MKLEVDEEGDGDFEEDQGRRVLCFAVACFRTATGALKCAACISDEVYQSLSSSAEVEGIRGEILDRLDAVADSAQDVHDTTIDFAAAANDLDSEELFNAGTSAAAALVGLTVAFEKSVDVLRRLSGRKEVGEASPAALTEALKRLFGEAESEVAALLDAVRPP